jgi:hypothetical protein
MSPDNPGYRRLRLAYADPPYYGMCSFYQHDHREPYGCWNELDAHRLLITNLAEFDGWALSLGSVHLRHILPLCPDQARVAAWVKPWCSFNAANPAFAWEPVIYVAGRNHAERGGREAWHVRDWIAESATQQKAIRGAKPDRFCRWVLDLLGYREGDEFTDLFPGSGVMERVRAQGVLL